MLHYEKDEPEPAFVHDGFIHYLEETGISNEQKSSVLSQCEWFGSLYFFLFYHKTFGIWKIRIYTKFQFQWYNNPYILSDQISGIFQRTRKNTKFWKLEIYLAAAAASARFEYL